MAQRPACINILLYRYWENFRRKEKPLFKIFSKQKIRKILNKGSYPEKQHSQ